jgi:hypothetical protein
MPNPLFYERQRRRISTWGVPRFLRSFDETLDGGLILPRAPIPSRDAWCSMQVASCAPHPGKTTAEIHDYLDQRTGVLAASLAKRAPGYTSLGFPDPRRLVAEPGNRRQERPGQDT